MLNNKAIPHQVKACVGSLVAHYKKYLASNLLSIVIHGSIAMGCFNPNSSDIDVLVIVQEPLSLETKQQLGKVHLHLSEQCPNPIELSVVLQSALDDFVYPTPFEFHYGDAHKQDFIDSTVDFITARYDPDLAAHFVISKHHGITLYGDTAQDIFPTVPDHDYLDSIADDAEWSYTNMMAGEDEGDCLVPTYAVLNFCRVSAFIETGLVTSKRTGGQWGLKHLPNAHSVVIQEALNEYNHTGSSQKVSCHALKNFADYAYNQIRRNR